MLQESPLNLAVFMRPSVALNEGLSRTTIISRVALYNSAFSPKAVDFALGTKSGGWLLSMGKSY